MARKGDHLVRSWRWRVTCVLAMVAYLATAIGFPVPALTVQDLSQPFPCQGHACGCRNARECWQHCCCFTPGEKLAWAEAHGVQVPADAEGWRDARLRDREKCACGGCAGIGGVARSAGPPAEACSCPRCAADAPRPSRALPAQASVRPARSSWILGVAVLGCRGASTDWVTGGAAAPPPPVVTWKPLRPLAERFSHAGIAAELFRSSPPDPPPRVSA